MNENCMASKVQKRGRLKGIAHRCLKYKGHRGQHQCPCTFRWDNKLRKLK